MKKLLTTSALALFLLTGYSQSPTIKSNPVRVGNYLPSAVGATLTGMMVYHIIKKDGMWYYYIPGIVLCSAIQAFVVKVPNKY